MTTILRRALDERRPCIEFILHFSELMPGANPTFHTPGDIERLYRDLEEFFPAARAHFRGMTLQEFGRDFAHTHADAPLRERSHSPERPRRSATTSR